MTSISTVIIAEAGVNHNGDLGTAIDLIDQAAQAGADMVKFQSFKANKIANASAPKAAYQVLQTLPDESQLDMLKRLELSESSHQKLIEHCIVRGITFLSTPFDFESLGLLVKKFALPCIKLGSGELTNAPLLLQVGISNVDVILSTGMSTLSEIEQALGVLGFAMMGRKTMPCADAFSTTLQHEDVWEKLRARVTLLHCTTDYPARDEETNLRAMDTMKQAFGLSVGYSDHTEGNAISIAAVARGARVIEKHFTLDRGQPGPDHAASIEPNDLRELVRDIRRVELALGTGIKQPAPSELVNRQIVRKSLVAAHDLPAGHILTADDIGLMRPGNGPAPITFWDRIGSTLERQYKAGDVLE
jgi:N-acetylneuraminate synthase